jgi:hypothetical protein
MTRTSLAALLAIGTAACSSTVDPQGGSGGGGSGAGGGNDACGTPDTSCPPEQPHPGAPCAGDLVCGYGDEVVPWNLECIDGRWEGEPDCSMVVGGCPIPEPAEGCEGAFAGQMPGTLRIGPADTIGEAFHAYAASEPVEVHWGGQGSAMIFYRLALDADAPPGCVAVRTTISAPGIMPETQSQTVRLRCGESLRMYVVVPAGSCDGSTTPVTTTVHVKVDGITETDVVLSVPADAFCAVL